MNRRNEKIEFELPFPPSANRYWRNVNGRMVKSAEADGYREEASWVALLALRDAGQHGKPLMGPVKAVLDFYFPSERGDLDNRIKIILDALQGVAYHNDSQIREIHARRFTDKQRPHVAIQIFGLIFSHTQNTSEELTARNCS